ncbi:MAG: midcut-by-XrtH protein [Chromatocurvus sp.]
MAKGHGTKRVHGVKAIVAGIATSVLALPALAGGDGGTITFSPSAVAAVPTLGNALLVLLAGLLGLIALKSYRRARGVTPMIAGLLAVAALASAGGGINLVRQAHAAIVANTITQPQGQTFPLASGPNSFLNDAGTTLETSDIQLAGSCSVGTNNSEDPDCAEGQTIADGDSCQIVVDCDVIAESDRRLKTDITLRGVAENGLPLYRFRYRDGSEYYEGVMAQDVLTFMPKAVVHNADGYYAVNYTMLGMSMRPVD